MWVNLPSVLFPPRTRPSLSMTVDGLSSPPGPRGLVNELAFLLLALSALAARLAS